MATFSPADTIKHGTYGGYQAHRKRARAGLPGGEPCTPCLNARGKYRQSLRASKRVTALPGPQDPKALTGDYGRTQDGTPGNPDAPARVTRHLYAVRGPTTTCGHDNPTVAIETEDGEVLSCRRCVLAAVDDRPGITYLEGLPGRGPLPDPGGDAA